jgi:hypothetical protein
VALRLSLLHVDFNQKRYWWKCQCESHKISHGDSIILRDSFGENYMYSCNNHFLAFHGQYELIIFIFIYMYWTFVVLLFCNSWNLPSLRCHYIVHDLFDNIHIKQQWNNVQIFKPIRYLIWRRSVHKILLKTS